MWDTVKCFSVVHKVHCVLAAGALVHFASGFLNLSLSFLFPAENRLVHLLSHSLSSEQVLSRMMLSRTLLTWDGKQVLLSHSFQIFSGHLSLELDSGINVEYFHSSGHSPVSQIATHILCILSSTDSPSSLNSSARTTTGPADFQLTVWQMAHATSEWGSEKQRQENWAAYKCGKMQNHGFNFQITGDWRDDPEIKNRKLSSSWWLKISAIWAALWQVIANSSNSCCNKDCHKDP